MNPHQQNKVDTASLSPEEQRLLRLYGKMPTKKDLLQNKLKERKYFDSGDYALSKAGKASDVGVTNIGSQHPVPENIPHLTATSPGANNPAAASNGGSTNSQGQQIPGSISGHPGSIGFQSRSPVKEGSYLQRGTSADESEGNTTAPKDAKEPSVSPPPARSGVPIRR
ncbi:camp-regulated phospho protein/endosulfine conserved region-domain-containing protein [Aspergillus caelatus]|uniref:mRNA stability protein n=2 Tax=Aspergillus subgen. Circumdati TaxID=2720871 RepID=A0A5N7AA37_9EURO|nr:camp-regulated phospho protein/endosulfine conserved region-domain-containing protein [Aspergillus caelatus]KAE8366682.1 camp-regulated phospho protein/endosulfine conserved region-domain-containing protein [Aspergillus caelatus]KAE8412239.1 camp-regulated phospho protein/endosulfine conserved region-domain-containing protein [Aspergillus pseudocaelatus]